MISKEMQRESKSKVQHWHRLKYLLGERTLSARSGKRCAVFSFSLEFFTEIFCPSKVTTTRKRTLAVKVATRLAKINSLIVFGRAREKIVRDTLHTYVFHLKFLKSFRSYARSKVITFFS